MNVRFQKDPTCISDGIQINLAALSVDVVLQYDVFGFIFTKSMILKTMGDGMFYEMGFLHRHYPDQVRRSDPHWIKGSLFAQFVRAPDTVLIFLPYLLSLNEGVN